METIKYEGFKIHKVFISKHDNVKKDKYLITLFNDYVTTANTIEEAKTKIDIILNNK